MQKYWYKIESTQDSSQEKLLTIVSTHTRFHDPIILPIVHYNLAVHTLVQAPVSQNCPLLLHKRQKGLNKLIEAVRVVSLFL